MTQQSWILIIATLFLFNFVFSYIQRVTSIKPRSQSSPNFDGLNVSSGLFNHCIFLSPQAATWLKAQTYQGIYASWAVLLLLVLLTLARAVYWACMRVSQPLQNFT